MRSGSRVGLGESALGVTGVAEMLRSLRLPPELSGHHCVVMGGRVASGQPATGSGFARTLGLARAKAVGEYVERYALLAPRAPTLAAARRRAQIAAPTLGAEEYPYFAADQYGVAGFAWRGLRDEDCYQWHWCRGMGPAPDRFIPADLVWLDRPSPIARLGSSGAAAHRSLQPALLNGLLELIERDALSAMWETRAVTPLLDLDDARRALGSAALLDRLEAAGQTVLLRDLTTDLDVPVVAAILIDTKGRRPALVMGAAARLEFGDAIDAAVLEAAATWAWMRDEHARLALSIEEVAALARTPEAPKWQAVLYGFPDMLEAAAPLTARAARSRRAWVRGAGSPNDLETLVEKLASAGIHCWWTSILPTELAAAGWHAVRVLAPALAPLGFGEICRPLGHPRVLDVALSCGWPHQRPSGAERRPPIPLP